MISGSVNVRPRYTKFLCAFFILILTVRKKLNILYNIIYYTLGRPVKVRMDTLAVELISFEESNFQCAFV